MTTVQQWINEFNKRFGLNLWCGNVEDDTVKLTVESPTGVVIGIIHLRKSGGIWRFSTIESAFGGEAWAKLVSI